MSARSETARHGCCHARARHRAETGRNIIADYELGALLAGLAFAVAVGCCIVHWAVVA